MLLRERAAAVVGAPWVLHGRDPRGWDCWGLVWWARWDWLGRDSPSWADAYAPRYGRALAVQTERLIAEKLAGWNAVPVRPGAVLLLKVFGRPAHVGLALEGDDFVHVMAGCATAIEARSGHRWEGRVLGCYDAP